MLCKILPSMRPSCRAWGLDMNAKVNRQITIFFLLLMVVGLSACGILEVSSEPAESQNEPMVTDTKVIRPSPTAAFEQMPAAMPAVPTVTIATVGVPTAAPVNLGEEAVPEAPTGSPAAGHYRNEATGISFSYPVNWTMEEETNVFILRDGSISLRIAYRRAGEQVALWTRTGIPAGDFVVLDGLVSFLGQTLAKSGLVYEDRLKKVFYGGEPVSIVEAEALEFTITLDDRGSDYLVLDIPNDVVAEAEAILASFAVDSNLRDPSGELLTYTNPEWGFALQYPPSWSVTKVNDEASAAPSSRSVWLAKGTVTLVIGFRQIDEAPPDIGTSVPAGDLETRGSVQMLGRDVPRQVLVFEGKDKVVFYGHPGVFINAGRLEFATRLDDFAQVDYRIIELSQGLQDEAELILSSLEVFGREG